MEQAKTAISGGMDSVKDLAGKALPAAQDGINSLKDLTGSPKMKELMPYLLAGGAGAAGAALLTGKRKARTGESRGSYLARILRNAAVTAAAVGGGSYLAHQGLKKTIGAADLENPITGSEDDAGPLSANTKAILTHPSTALAAGALGLGVASTTPLVKELIGANPGAAEAGKAMIQTLKTQNGGKVGKNNLSNVYDTKSLSAAARNERPLFERIMRGDKGAPGTIPATLRDQARLAGVNLHNPSAPLSGRVGSRVGKGAVAVDDLIGKGLAKLPDVWGTGMLKNLLGGRLGKMTTGVGYKAHELGRIPSTIFGRTWGRRLTRGGVASVAALAPTVINSILSNPSKDQ